MNPVRRAWTGGATLALAAVGVWARDLRWTEMAADTLPLAVGIPAAFWIGGPWHLSPRPLVPKERTVVLVAASAFLAAWVFQNLTLLSLSWAALCSTWAASQFTSSPNRSRLIGLLILSFPWLVLEWQGIGWAFRVSSAAVAESIFHVMAMPVHREGTHLNVMGVPIEIEAACAGWNLLQLTLLAGVTLGSREILSSTRFYFLLAALPAVAWLANLLRILLLSALALSFDVELASGAVHGLTGLAVLAAVLAMTKALCTLLNPPQKARIRRVHSP